MSESNELIREAKQALEELTSSASSPRTRALSAELLGVLSRMGTGGKLNHLIVARDYEPPVMRALQLSEELLRDTPEQADQQKLRRLQIAIRRIFGNLWPF